MSDDDELEMARVQAVLSKEGMTDKSEEWWANVMGEVAVLSLDELRQQINAMSEQDRIPGLCFCCGCYTYEALCQQCEHGILLSEGGKA